MRRVWGVITIVVGMAWFNACGPENVVPASLDLMASPVKIKRDGTKSMLTFTATDEHGLPGSGDVYVESSVGTLSTGTTVTLDSTGTAGAQFACDIADDVGCSVDVAQVLATWRRPTLGNVHGSINVRLLDTGTSGTGGSGGGSGSGGGTGGTFVGAGHEVMLIGTLATVGSLDPCLMAVAQLDTPTNPTIAFACADNLKVAVAPDGSLVWGVRSSIGKMGTPLYHHVPDTFVTAPGPTYSYPSTPEANDTVITVPACPGSSWDDFILQAGTGAVWPHCSETWYAPDGTAVISGFGKQLLAVTSSGLMMMVDSTNTLSVGRAGASFVVVKSIAYAGSMTAWRVSGDRFNVIQQTGIVEWQLKALDAAGAATLLGTYKVPTGYAVAQPTAVDASNNAYCIGTKSGVGDDNVIQLRFEPAVGRSVYSDHNQDNHLSSDIAHLFVRLYGPGHKLLQSP